ncbi:hypothetical protein F2Q68_00007855 [Brassica cretica]|uniref:Uncharacterized protein n=1 Tax=Brassica cretica TaxID=69181 RepID=A0A8S9L3Q9_BRACR|nr:hypothetical protein F2Q68_00007855 [Brassica cretica]
MVKFHRFLHDPRTLLMHNSSFCFADGSENKSKGDENPEDHPQELRPACGPQRPGLLPMAAHWKGGILKAITGGCFGGQEPRTSAAEQTPQQSHRAGKEPAGSSAGAERLPRNRRTAGRSESGESD